MESLSCDRYQITWEDLQDLPRTKITVWGTFTFKSSALLNFKIRSRRHRNECSGGLKSWHYQDQCRVNSPPLDVMTLRNSPLSEHRGTPSVEVFLLSPRIKWAANPAFLELGSLLHLTHFLIWSAINRCASHVLTTSSMLQRSWVTKSHEQFSFCTMERSEFWKGKREDNG